MKSQSKFQDWANKIGAKYQKLTYARHFSPRISTTINLHRTYPIRQFLLNMKYGIYTASLSIGYSGADYTEDWDVRDDYSEQEWEDLGDEGQDLVLREFMNDSVGRYIELTYWEKE